MSRMVIVLLVAWVGCGEEKPFPTANLPIPEASRVRHVNERQELIVYDNNLVIDDSDHNDPDSRIAILDAHMEDQAYVATRLVRAWLGDSGWETEAVGGTLRFEGDLLSVDLTGRMGSRWNGSYESRTLRSRREAEQRRLAREAEAAERAARGEPEPVVERSPCQQYRDCICALSAAATLRGGANPFQDGCADAERLLRTAPDDPAMCRVGLEMNRGVAPSLGIAVPEVCGE